jgi:hypothetical protein
LAIDFRLRQIRPQFQDIPFGGVSVVLFGDFGQLPPVIDSALYQSPTEKSPLIIHQTSQLYRSTFSRAFNLTQQMRQQGQTEMDNKFQEGLGHLRLGTVTKADWEFFQSQIYLSKINNDLNSRLSCSRQMQMSSNEISVCWKRSLTQIKRSQELRPNITESQWRKVQRSNQTIAMVWNMCCMFVLMPEYLLR